jgi:putative two-component system response regulator
METAFCAGTNIKMIMESLPRDEVEHMRRVGILVDVLTQKFCGFDICQKYTDEYKYFGLAAAYHDIGKAWIPKSILTKPGDLTGEERTIIRRHRSWPEKYLIRLMLGICPEYRSIFFIW